MQRTHNVCTFHLKGSRKAQFLDDQLDDRPAENPTSKTLNYINGNHFVQEDSENELVVANGYRNGQVCECRAIYNREESEIH